jgi:hypothetical protein
MTPVAYFLEIIDPNHIDRGDLEIIAEASYDRPGQVKLGQARIADPPVGAPNARRLVSHNGGGIIGIIATAEFMMAPYNFSYWLLPLAPPGVVRAETGETR